MVCSLNYSIKHNDWPSNLQILIFAMMFLLSTVEEILSKTTEVDVVPSFEKQLIKRLMERYEEIGKMGRPVQNTSDTITVEYGLSLFQILDLDEKNQVLTTNVWNKLKWSDQLLSWRPSDYDNLKVVRIPVVKIWCPDIVLYNYADERLEVRREVMVTVDYTGKTFWSPPSVYKSTCRIDIRYFPFDYQICDMRFASWTQDGQKLDIQFFANSSEVSLEEYIHSNEWDIVARPAFRISLKLACCKNEFPHLIFFLILKRNPAFYAYLLVLPCLLLSSLTLVIFWLPPQVPGRMLLGMNIFVAFSFLLKILANSTPSASTTVPYLGYYYSLNMVLISLSTFFSLIVVNLHFRCDRHHHPSNWMIKIVDLVSTFLCLGSPGEGSNWCSEAKSKKSSFRLSKRKPPQAFQLRQLMGLEEPRWQQKSDCSSSRPPDRASSLLRQDQRCCEHSSVLGRFKSTAHVESANRNPVFRSGDDSMPYRSFKALHRGGVTQMKTSAQQLEINLSEIKRSLRNLMTKIQEKDKGIQRASEWALIAMTLDRTFFWIFLIIMVVSGFGMLVPPSIDYTKETVINEYLRLHFYSSKLNEK